MSFYEFLTTSKKRLSKRFSDLTKEEISFEEKELRLESKMINQSGSDQVLNFLNALHETPIGLDFLIDNPNLAKAIFLQKPKFNKSEKTLVMKYQRKDIQHFFYDFLQVELESAIGEAATLNNYSRLLYITKFNKYLPEEIILLLKSKILDKLKVIEKRVNAGIFGVVKELEEIKHITIFLGDQNLIKKCEVIQNLAMKHSLEEVHKPGIVHFFTSIDDFFDALRSEPKTVIEKEKKRETLRGCGMVFLVVAIIILCCFLFIKIFLLSDNKETVAKNYPTYYKNSDKFPSYLTDFKREEVTNYKYIGPTSPQGFPLDRQFSFYPNDVLSRGPNIINNSSFDLIFFSTENTFPLLDTPDAAATYIQSGSSGYTGAHYLNRMYFGDSLSLFNTKYDQKNSTTKRFIAQPKFSKECIKYRIHFRGRNTITIIDSLDRIFIDGTGGIELYFNETIRSEKLPLLFPPKS
ncbi:hypothetical protein [Luteirhabdus pelagi]|uniref:hypothetical protein n=1 Tax=Luteirhabdus pelagi TaxID=2792783 RepID=UPI00193A38EE|nr:hypothetical protein [Luteirhabdus pelagi]